MHKPINTVKCYTTIAPLACVASVSVGLGSKERPMSAIFDVFPNETEQPMQALKLQFQTEFLNLKENRFCRSKRKNC